MAQHCAAAVVAAALFSIQGPALLEIPAGLDLHMPIPDDNPLSPERVRLGERLFFDPLLSRDRHVRCATCHDPRQAFTDGRSLSAGIEGRTGVRHAPTLVNAGYRRTLFWDGRASRLEDQVLQPIDDPAELGLGIDHAVARVAGEPDYVAGFHVAFGRKPNADDLARALASYVRTIVAGDSPLDRHLNGDRAALSVEAREGLRVFRGPGRCTACHLGPDLTDDQFHNTGIAWRDGSWADLGRFRITGDERDRGAFKTPTLREVGRTAPYMHDGSVRTLDDVVEFYTRGGNRNPYLDPDLRPLRLSAEEKHALVAFLRALSAVIRHGIPSSPA